MSASNSDYISETDDRRKNQCDGTDFSTPLGNLKSGRLIFAAGVEWSRITAGSDMPYLYRARFKRYAPRVWVQESSVAITHRRTPAPDHLVNLDQPLAEIRLNSSVPWEIEFRRGVSHLTADLTQLQLCSLDILGGADRIQLLLSEPSGSAFIYISGGIHQGLIRVPPTTGVRVQVSGGSSNLIFVDQHLGRVGSETSLENIGYAHARQRYDIRITGGSRDLTIERI